MRVNDILSFTSLDWTDVLTPMQLGLFHIFPHSLKTSAFINTNLKSETVTVVDETISPWGTFDHVPVCTVYIKQFKIHFEDSLKDLSILA